MSDYPGRIIKINEPDAATVSVIAGGLQAKGYPSNSPAGIFDSAFKSLVKLYQSQHSDAFGRPLEIDGEVGSLTWGSIFGVAHENLAPTGEAAGALGVAVSQLGVMEVPIGTNRGPMVDVYQTRTGLTLPAGQAPGHFWCMAFVYWCFHKAGAGTTQFPRTAGCLDAWTKVRSRAPQRIITRAAALANPALVKPGMIFILDHGGGLGHTGFVRQSAGGALRTVEGNTNPNGSANGIGVFELNRRKIIDASLKGFLDFS
jgi:CHAP domain